MTLEQGGGPRAGLFDEKVLASPEAEFEQHLNGHTIVRARRKGKQIWWELDG